MPRRCQRSWPAKPQPWPSSRYHRAGADWRAGSLAGEPGRSPGVHLFGPKAGLWVDFATGESGDTLDLEATVLFHGDLRPALDWTRA